MSKETYNVLNRPSKVLKRPRTCQKRPTARSVESDLQTQDKVLNRPSTMSRDPQKFQKRPTERWRWAEWEGRERGERKSGLYKGDGYSPLNGERLRQRHRPAQSALGWLEREREREACYPSFLTFTTVIGDLKQQNKMCIDENSTELYYNKNVIIFTVYIPISGKASWPTQILRDLVT